MSFNPFGEVASGEIRLRCQTKPVRVCYLDPVAGTPGRANRSKGQADSPGDARYLDEEDTSFHGPHWQRQTEEGTERLWEFGPDIHAGWAEGEWVNAVFVPLSMRAPEESVISYSWPTDAVRGIALVSAGEEDQSVYRRCGSFYASTWGVFGTSSWKGVGKTATWEPVANTELCEITII